MARRITSALIGSLLALLPFASKAARPSTPPSAAAQLYDLLFCDDLSRFAPLPGQSLTDWQALLLASDSDPEAVARLAEDRSTESRVRALAYGWLRAHDRPTPKGVLLGVIVEVPLKDGLDVLAAYEDGRVRYLNQSGKVGVFEPGGAPDVERQARRLIEAAGPVVARIGPWDKPRLPAPTKPDVRISFVVSDGLYFGQGPFDVMQKDPMAGPLLDEAAKLLSMAVGELAKPAP